MTASEKHAKQANARQAVRNARKAAQRTVALERIAAVHVLAAGQELIECKPVTIPGYPYSF